MPAQFELPSDQLAEAKSYIARRHHADSWFLQAVRCSTADGMRRILTENLGVDDLSRFRAAMRKAKQRKRVAKHQQVHLSPILITVLAKEAAERLRVEDGLDSVSVAIEKYLLPISRMSMEHRELLLLQIESCS